MRQEAICQAVKEYADHPGMNKKRIAVEFGASVCTVNRQSEASHDCYEVTFVKWTEKFSRQLNKSSSFNPDSTWKEL